MLSGVLVKMGAMVRPRGVFYKLMVQAVLLYGSEIWDITDSMMKVLERFCHCIAWRIVGNTAQHAGA